MDLLGGSRGLPCSSGPVIGWSRGETAFALGRRKAVSLKRHPAGSFGSRGGRQGAGLATAPARTLTPALGSSERLSASQSCELARRGPQRFYRGPSCAFNSLSNSDTTSRVRPPRAQAPAEPSLDTSRLGCACHLEREGLRKRTPAVEAGGAAEAPEAPAGRPRRRASRYDAKECLLVRSRHRQR